jgi:putative ATP-binding cassette transporter
MVSGSILRPPNSEVIFIPQKPYLLFVATLKEQIMYPHTLTDENSISDDQLCELLEFVHLSRLFQAEFLERINWISLLSPGEVIPF